MLKIHIPEKELYNEETNEFKTFKAMDLQLEHSLISLSKWEAKWKKPFLDDRTDKTEEEMLDYILCMNMTQNVDPEFPSLLSSEQKKEISDYINEKQTATWFSEDSDKDFKRYGGRNGTVMTSEVLYYLMVACQIPFECQKWHLSRLITLIRVYQEKNKDPKKMSKSEILARNKRLNDARRKALGTKG